MKHRKETHELGEQTCGCQGGGEGVGWTGSLGLIDANYCIWSGWAMRSCCIAQGTLSSTDDGTWWRMMWEKKIYVYVWVGYFAV